MQSAPRTQRPLSQVCPVGHAPQSSVPLQPSPIRPQYWPPGGVQLTLVQGPAPPSADGGTTPRPSVGRASKPRALASRVAPASAAAVSVFTFAQALIAVSTRTKAHAADLLAELTPVQCSITAI